MFSKNLLVRVITHWIVLKSVKLLVNILGTMRINSSNKTKVLLTSIQQAIKAVFVDSVVKMTQLILCQLINDQRFQSLVVLGFNTTLTAKVCDAHVFPGFLTPVLPKLSFQSHRLLSSHNSAKVRDENTPDRRFASNRSQIHNHHVMSLTCSPLTHLGGQRIQSCNLLQKGLRESIID